MTAIVDHHHGAPARHRLSVGEFVAFCATNPARYERYELINGEIYEPMTESLDHARMVERIAAALRRDAAPGQEVLSHGSVELDGDGMPLPDIYVVKPGAAQKGDYFNGQQLDLVVEVAKSTWAFDVGSKMANYAVGGVPHYYVVKLSERGEPTLTCYSMPQGNEYRSSAVHKIDYLLGPNDTD